MKPIDLIKDDLGEEVWAECSSRTSSSGEIEPAVELSPFSTSKSYQIHGRIRQFDFPTLPHGSYCLYDANGRRAIRLTRVGKEIESVLKENWKVLAECDLVVLARLILKFYDDGIKATHSVLPDVDSLLSFSNYHVVNERELEKVQHKIGITSFTCNAEEFVIRAITLCGWMHDKRNLGVEHIRILRSGNVELDARKVLSKKIFKSVPKIRY